MITKNLLIEKNTAPNNFLFFWGHTPKKLGTIDKSCLSQWYPARFNVDGRHYSCTEKYMMASKAELFGDSDTFKEIILATSPRIFKALGRKIANYDEKTWELHRVDIVLKANLEKFKQNKELEAFLKSTGNKVLVEAAPNDKVWGIGIAFDHPNATKPQAWLGQNLLGFILMEVREQLIAA